MPFINRHNYPAILAARRAKSTPLPERTPTPMPTETVNANPSQTAAKRAAAALKLSFAQSRMVSLTLAPDSSESARAALADAERDLIDAERESFYAYHADVRAGGPA